MGDVFQEDAHVPPHASELASDIPGACKEFEKLKVATIHLRQLFSTNGVFLLLLVFLLGRSVLHVRA